MKKLEPCLSAFNRSYFCISFSPLEAGKVRYNESIIVIFPVWSLEIMFGDEIKTMYMVILYE